MTIEKQEQIIEFLKTGSVTTQDVRLGTGADLSTLHRLAKDGKISKLKINKKNKEGFYYLWGPV